MKKLGEQWVEEIDGKKHMLKLVELHNYDKEACSGCDFFSAGTIRMHGSEHGSMKHVHPMCNLHCSPGLGLRDLGVVDENGLLPCPVKTEDPSKPFFGKAGYRDGYSWQGWKACQPIVVNGTAVGELYVYGNTEEECRDNWNRRALIGQGEKR